MKKSFVFLLTIFIEILYTLSNVTVQSQQIDFTCVSDGTFAYNACTQYVRCVQTGISSAYKVLYSCSSGTLYDIKLQKCNWASNVICQTPAVTTNEITASARSTNTFQQTTTSK